MSNTTGNTESYQVRMGCLNCGADVNMKFKQGVEVPRRVTCPNCGCDSLIKTIGATRQGGTWSSGMAECIEHSP